MVNKVLQPTGKTPGKRITVNFYNFEKEYNGNKSLILFTDRVSGFIQDYYLTKKIINAIIICFQYLIKLFEVQYKTRLKIIESDNEINTQKPRVR